MDLGQPQQQPQIPKLPLVIANVLYQWLRFQGLEHTAKQFMIENNTHVINDQEAIQQGLRLWFDEHEFETSYLSHCFEFVPLQPFPNPAPLHPGLQPDPLQQVAQPDPLHARPQLWPLQPPPQAASLLPLPHAAPLPRPLQQVAQPDPLHARPQLWPLQTPPQAAPLLPLPHAAPLPRPLQQVAQPDPLHARPQLWPLQSPPQAAPLPRPLQLVPQAAPRHPGPEPAPQQPGAQPGPSRPPVYRRQHTASPVFQRNYPYRRYYTTRRRGIKKYFYHCLHEGCTARIRVSEFTNYIGIKRQWVKTLNPHLHAPHPVNNN